MADQPLNYFKSSPDSIILINPKYFILDINTVGINNIQSYFGKTAQKGDSIFDYIEEPSVLVFKNNFKKALAGQQIRVQSIIPEKDNYQRQIVTYCPLYDNERKISGVIYQTTVVPGQRQTDEILNENSYRIKLVLLGANVGLWDWNLETGMHYFDPTWWAMIGYEQNELIFNSDFRDKIYHPDDIEKVRTVFNNAVDSGQTNYEIEYRMIHKDGHFIPVLSSGYILRDENGLPIRVSGTNIDLTERKKEQERLQRSENHLRTIFENTQFGYLFINDNLEILSYNQPAMQMCLALNKKEISTGVNVLDLVVIERKEDFKHLLAKVFAGEQTEYDRVILNEKNEEEWYHLILSPVRNKSGRVVNIIMSSENITQRKKDELHLNKSFDHVSAQNKRLMSFSYIVSHNLRSHTSNIISLVDFLIDAETEEEKSEMTQHLRTVSNSLDETLANLNDIISIHTNINLIFEPLILNAFIKKAIEVLRDQIQLKDATVENYVSNDIVINYNPAYIESILLNFLSNALKYSHQDRKPLVKIDYFYENGKLVLQISDNGIGIDMKKNGDKIFGLYKTFNGNSDARGIGLFITKSQIEFMGGKVSVASELDKGTTFKIYF